MKKKLVFIISLLLILYGMVFAQTANDVKVWIMPTEGKNLSDGEKLWLPQDIHRALSKNFTNYSGFIIVEEDSDYLADIQARSYNENIPDSEAVKMGKQMGANHVILSTITKTGSGYSLNIIMLEMERGKHLAESLQVVKTSDKLYGNPGCAVNEATIEICNKLESVFNIVCLSSMDKRVLRYGDQDLSAEEEQLYIQETLKKWNEQIENLDRQISITASSTDADAAAQNALLRAQKDYALEQQRQAAEKSKRAAEEAQRRADDLVKQGERDDAQKKRINDVQNKIKEKVNEVRKTNFETGSVFSQIKQIESKKKALVEIRTSGSLEEYRIRTEYDKDYEAKRIEIMHAKLRDGEKDINGNMLPEVRERRAQQLKKYKEELDKAMDADIKAAKQIADSAEKELMTQINEELKILKNGKHTADNIKKDLAFNISVYDGGSKTWVAAVFLDLDGQRLYAKNFTLGYEIITGKKIPSIGDKEWDDYLDTVDLYNSLFANSIPVTVKLSYTVEACPDNEPSKYRFHVDKLEFFRTAESTSKPFTTEVLNEDFYVEMEPQYDIRTQKAYQTDQKIEKTKKQYSDYISQFNQKTGTMGSMAGIGIAGVFNMQEPSNTWAGWANLPVSNYAFFGVNFGEIPTFTQLLPYASANSLYWNLGIGFNKRILVLFPPNIYARVGFGEYIVNYKKQYGFIYDGKYETIGGFSLFQITAGVEIPLKTPVLSIDAGASLYIVKDFGSMLNVHIGLNLDLLKTGLFNWLLTY